MRRNIHYWKCDRPAAMHGVAAADGASRGLDILPDVRRLLSEHFPEMRSLKPAGGKGNHHTYLLELASGNAFVRVEDGPEQDGHLAMESRVIGVVRETGVPVPRVLFTDATRARFSFAVQVIEYLDCPDLNALHLAGRLPLERIAEEIGRGIARWQDAPAFCFGPFDPEATERCGYLTGYHESYAGYFCLQLSRHLELLVASAFITEAERKTLHQVIDDHVDLLNFAQGCLVHKDVALWNIMGTTDGIRAFIDWDDAIAGDPTDDLSLLACFHPAPVVQAAVEGYVSIKSLPHEFKRRFWLHLLRNMIVKSVIRCGAGYFKPDAKGAFLMGAGQDGPAFRQFTRDRLWTAVRGLRENQPLTLLSS